jgi:hypothetical protein
MRDIAVEHRHHLIAARHRQAATRQEIVLDVRDQQHVAGLQLPAFQFGCFVKHSWRLFQIHVED